MSKKHGGKGKAKDFDDDLESNHSSAVQSVSGDVTSKVASKSTANKSGKKGKKGKKTDDWSDNDDEQKLSVKAFIPCNDDDESDLPKRQQAAKKAKGKNLKRVDSESDDGDKLSTAKEKLSKKAEAAAKKKLGSSKNNRGNSDDDDEDKVSAKPMAEKIQAVASKKKNKKSKNDWSDGGSSDIEIKLSAENSNQDDSDEDVSEELPIAKIAKKSRKKPKKGKAVIEDVDVAAEEDLDDLSDIDIEEEPELKQDEKEVVANPVDKKGNLLLNVL